MIRQYHEVVLASAREPRHPPYLGDAGIRSPEVAERLGSAGAEDSGGTPERFAEFMRSERSKYVKLAKDASIKVDS